VVVQQFSNFLVSDMRVGNSTTPGHPPCVKWFPVIVTGSRSVGLLSFSELNSVEKLLIKDEKH
jgi:hypothetical protein